MNWDVDSQLNEAFSCIILAGGHSRRMGQDKALLPCPGNEGHTFVEHMVALLAPVGREVILVARDEQQAEGYTFLSGVRIVTDQETERGPLMGFYSGLSALHPSSTYALVVAVDMPLVQPALISYLLSLATSDAIVMPFVQEAPQVMLAVYPRAILPIAAQCLREGRRGIRSILEVAPVSYIEEAQLRNVDPELRSFVNVNTPEELEQI